ncbi:alkaline phosphatase family protein [Aliihoeflea sp. PC F10.4]
MRASTMRERPRAVAIFFALAILVAVLALPGRPQDATLPQLAHLPLELVAMVAILLFLPRGGLVSGTVRTAFTVLLATLLLLKIADLSLYGSLNRPFNLAYDLPLLHAGWMLVSGTSGLVRASIYVVGAGFSIIFAAIAIWWATGIVARLRPRRAVPIFVVSLIFAFALASIGRASFGATELLVSHVEAARTAQTQIAALENEAGTDDIAIPADANLLQALKGRDVFFIFVESYGRSTLDNPLYADTTREALADLETNAAHHGLAVKSAFLTAPTVGGQSWLAHASVLSGLWIDSQGRYRAMLASSRKSLMQLASESGWESVGVMPAITMAWPEGAWFGYDHILAKDDLGYRGLPFNWVTMPDQYTLSAFERLALKQPDRAPVFAEIALISSHAPWTPIPEPVDWDAIGDGRIFDVQAQSGDTPEMVWRDRDRVRDQFRQSINYSLRTVASFLDRLDGPPPLIVVLGDHQPATFVSGSETNRDVPIHIISDHATLNAIEGWAFSEGAVPADDAPVWRMDAFRKRFVDAFSTPLPQDGQANEPV